MIFEMLIVGLIILLCVLFPKYIGIIISLSFILTAIFYENLEKFPSRGELWFYKDDDENEKKTKIIFRIIFFLIGIIGLACTLFF